MPKFTHQLSIDYTPSVRTSMIEGMFDVSVEKKLSRTWEIDIPIENEEWSVGVIVGPSGCGKTTIAKRAFEGASFFDGTNHKGWDSSHFVDDFKEGLRTLEDITPALSQVGFSSPPSWLLPFNALSNGQKFRAEMARLMLETQEGETLVVDEFTSLVDREVAKACAAAVQKAIRRSKRKLVAVSCHSDIIEWLEPDWVYRVDVGKFELTRGKLRRPKIELSIQRVHHSAWGIFKGHHYLDANVNKAAHCYVAFIGETPVAFAAAMPFPHAITKNVWKGHRTVVLPDYQGIGIGNAMSEAIAQHYTDIGKIYRSVTSHPAMIAHRCREGSKWVLTRKPGTVSPQGSGGELAKTSSDRITASFEYIGDGSPRYMEKAIPKKKERKALSGMFGASSISFNK